MRRAWAAFGITAAVCCVLQLGGEDWALALRYERDALLAGQVWRFVTGHLVHVGWAHLGVNLAVAAVVTGALGRHLSLRALLVCALGVSAGLFLALLRLQWYVGLSGVLHGGIVHGSLEAWRETRRRVWLVVLALVAVKVAWEHLRDPASGVAALIGAPVIVEAHLFGALSGGLAFALLYRPRRR